MFQAMGTTGEKNQKSESPRHYPSQGQLVLSLFLSGGSNRPLMFESLHSQIRWKAEYPQIP